MIIKSICDRPAILDGRSLHGGDKLGCFDIDASVLATEVQEPLCTLLMGCLQSCLVLRAPSLLLHTGEFERSLGLGVYSDEASLL